MQERGMENDPRYKQMLNLAQMNGLPIGMNTGGENVCSISGAF